MPRARPSLKTKLAVALGQLFNISYTDAVRMHEDEVISLGELHHNIRDAEGGSIHHSNLIWMRRAEHRERTAKIDIPEIAKNKRVRRKYEAHVERMRSK